MGIIITIRNLREMGFSAEEAGQLLASNPAATKAQLDSQLARNEETIRNLLHKNQVLKTRSDSLA